MAEQFNASREAEASLIGCVITDPALWWSVLGRVAESDFSIPLHAEIWRALGGMMERSEPVDAFTVGEACGGLAETLQAVERIFREVVSVANVESYLHMVTHRSRMRNAIIATSNSLIEMKEGSPDSISKLQQKLEEISADRGANSIAFSDALNLAMKEIVAARELGNGEVVGVPTGMGAIDRRTGGMRPHALWILAARPSLGKTALALQFALDAAKRGYSIGVMSLEMSASELATRSISHEYRLNVSGLSFGDKATLEKLHEQVQGGKNIRDLPIYIDDETFSVNGIISRATEWKRLHNIDLLIVDHLQLVEQTGDNRNNSIGEITRKLKLLAKRLAIPVLLLCQLSRDVEKGPARHPRLSDLRDSGNIEQDADVVLMIHGQLDGDGNPAVKEGTREVELGLTKNRSGKVGWLTEKFLFFGAEQRFGEVDRFAVNPDGSWETTF